MKTESEADPQGWAPTCTVILALSLPGCKPRKGSLSHSDLWLCFVSHLCKTATTTHHSPTGSLASRPHYLPFGSLHSRCRGFSATQHPNPQAPALPEMLGPGWLQAHSLGKVRLFKHQMFSEASPHLKPQINPIPLLSVPSLQSPFLFCFSLALSTKYAIY